MNCDFESWEMTEALNTGFDKEQQPFGISIKSLRHCYTHGIWFLEQNLSSGN